MDIKTKAIVLRSLKYGESSLIVDLLTESQGRLSFMVHVSKSPKAKFRTFLFQPMTILEINFRYRERAGLQHLTDVRIATSLYGVASNPVKTTVMLFLAEFLYYVTRDEQLNSPLFVYIESSLLWYDSAKTDYANFHLVFMMRLSRFVGFFPNLDDYVPGEYFDLREGRFTAVAPLHKNFLQPAEASVINTLMRMNYESMHLFRMNHDDRNHITETILVYYRLHVPSMPELHSFEVLKTMFADNG